MIKIAIAAMMDVRTPTINSEPDLAGFFFFAIIDAIIPPGSTRIIASSHSPTGMLSFFSSSGALPVLISYFGAAALAAHAELASVAPERRLYSEPVTV